MFFFSGILFGVIITSINLFLLFIFYRKFKLNQIKPYFIMIYIFKYLISGLAIFLFLKFQLGHIMGLFIGITAVILIFNLGVVRYVSSSRSS